MDANLSILVQLFDKKKRDAEANRASSVQMDAVKSSILNYMATNNQQCVTIRDDLHVLMVDKVSKIPLTQAEFLNTLFQKYCESHSIHVDNNVSTGFHGFCILHQDRLASKTRDIKLSKRRPMSAFF